MSLSFVPTSSQSCISLSIKLFVLFDSIVGGADALDSTVKPREQAKEDEIEVYRDIILQIPREQAKEDEIEV
jgi:hypothetical protein